MDSQQFHNKDIHLNVNSEFGTNNGPIQKHIRTISNSNLEYIDFNKKVYINSKPKVLISTISWGSLSGMAVHALNLYKKLLANQIDASLLIFERKKFIKGSSLQKELHLYNLSYYAVYDFNYKSTDDCCELMSYFCNGTDSFDIIHINSILPDPLILLYQPVKIFNKILIVQNHGIFIHESQKISQKDVNNHKIDAYIFAHKKSLPDYHDLDKINSNYLTPKLIMITSMYGADRFLNFKPLYNNRDECFKKLWNIKLKGLPVIVIVARISNEKNHELLIKAISCIDKIGMPVNLICAGSGHIDIINDLQNLAKQINVNERIHFIGEIPPELIPELLYHADIFVLPSKYEQFGLVVLEAALMKKPIILSKSAGAANHVIIHKKTGLLHSKDSITDLAQCIEKILNNNRLAQKLGKNAYKLVCKNYTPDKLVRKYIYLYNNYFKSK